MFDARPWTRLFDATDLHLGVSFRCDHYCLIPVAGYACPVLFPSMTPMTRQHPDPLQQGASPRDPGHTLWLSRFLRLQG